MREHLFTVVVTVLSKLIRLHDRWLGGVQVDAEVEGPEFTRHRIQSGRNTLDAVWCEPEGRARCAVLICHGIGDTVAYWTRVQRLLAADGVASLVFDYSGYGRSSGWISARQCEADTVAAMRWMRGRFVDGCGENVDRCGGSVDHGGATVALLGFSMGTGVAGAVAKHLSPDKLVMAGGFTSFREAAVQIGWPGWLAWMSPRIWDNCEALRQATMPVLVVHGDADRLFPCEMAHSMAGACASECETMVVPGLTHAGPLFRAGPEYWHAVSAWLKR